MEDEITPVLSSARVCEDPEPEATTQGLKVYKRRFWVLFAFSLLSAQQSNIWLTYGVIPNETCDYYGVDSWQVDLLAAWGPIIFIPFVFFSSWYLQRYGLRSLVRLGAWLVLIGTGLRCLIPRGYETDLFFLVHIGQILNAAVGPIVMATPPKLSVDWFPASQRTSATAISAVSNSFGVAFGFLLVPALVSSFNAMGYAGVQYMVFTEFWMTAAICAMVFAYFPAHPPTPPSLSSQTERLPFKESLLAASSNSTFWILCICGGVSQGIFSGWSSVLSIILNKQSGYNDDVSVSGKEMFVKSTAWLGCLSTIIGIIAGLTFGFIADLLPRNLKRLILVLLFACVACFTWFVLSVYKVAHVNWLGSAFISCVLGSSFLGATNPLFYEAAVEVAYPVPEGTAAGVLTLLNNIGCLLFQIIGMAGVFNASHPERARAMNFVLVGSIAACGLVVIFYRETYRRSQVDAAGSATSSSGDDKPKSINYGTTDVPSKSM
ncbi:solute carrier family 49 member 4-like [Sycon ciliatum]|uniref:solute carrier family 49 member 4-like n=1 Tax=Sycon ciliatum TaxID=27933 RepID=UPI0031F6B993|eukprot:scpid31199/ scgid16922/ Disrupted in renal carcinoma protein 2 homolog